MQNLSARLTENVPQEIKVGMNECRLAGEGQRLVARSVFADVVLTIQVPSLAFAAMLRFSVPEEASDSNVRLRALTEFADQALTLLFESMHSMNIPAGAMTVSAIGGADVEGFSHGPGGQLALAVEKSLSRHGVILNGSDLGGMQIRSVWLESSSGRLIVRSTSRPLNPSVISKSAYSLVANVPPVDAPNWQLTMLRNNTA
jgi:chemotaxis receptor (MCP) glutamine deamidase CheD